MFKCEVCSYECNSKSNFKRHTEMHEGARYSCPLCTLKFSSRSGFLRHMSDIHDIGANRRPCKRRVTAQNNVPDIRSESDVTDIASYNLRPRNPLGVVHRKECLNTGYTLRKLHEEYLEAQHSQDKRLVWASHANSLSQKLNLDMQVIEMLMLDIYADYSTSIDENLIRMLHQSSLFCAENIQHHTQHYIFVQLVYGLMKIYETGFEDLQSHRKSNWIKNTITILEHFEFNDDTAEFIIERMENFI